MEFTPTLVIALWGAILSTVLAVRQVLNDRLRIELTAWRKSTKISDRPMAHSHAVMVSVFNRGRRPIYILDVGYAAQRRPKTLGKELSWEKAPRGYEASRETQLPLIVEPGSRADFAVWDMIDSWPDGLGRGDIWAGVRSSHKSWVAPAVDHYVS